jgi:DNA repair ATPase RecN
MAGIIIAIYAIVKAMEYSKKVIDERYETTTEKMEDLKKVEEELVDQTKELSDELSNIGNKRNRFREMIKEMEKLKKGTAEWAANLHESRT